MTFLNLNNSYKDSIAIITDDRKTIKYGELIDYSNLIFSHIKHRCLLFCLCQNHLESLCGYLGFISNKVVPLMLDSSLDKDLLNELIKTYKPEYIWLPNNRLTDYSKEEVVFSGKEYTLLKLEFEEYYVLHSDLALLLTTSGSTGSPKLVRIRIFMLMLNQSQNTLK
jgi:long-chain acyl-CoA synthetase